MLYMRCWTWLIAVWSRETVQMRGKKPRTYISIGPNSAVRVKQREGSEGGVGMSDEGGQMEPDRAAVIGCVSRVCAVCAGVRGWVGFAAFVR